MKYALAEHPREQRQQEIVQQSRYHRAPSLEDRGNTYKFKKLLFIIKIT